MTKSSTASPADVESCELEALRTRLDRLDERLLEALDSRIRCCVEIAHVKRREHISMMQPQRIGIVHRRARAFAETHRIDAEFLRRLYDLVIAETCRVEDLIIDGPFPSGDTGVTTPTPVPAR